jgi:hypothetical protein
MAGWDAIGRRLTKSLRVSGTTVARSPVRPSGLLDQVIYPAEAPLPAGSQVDAIRVDYPDAEVGFFGWRTHWTIASRLAMPACRCHAMRRTLQSARAQEGAC